MHENASTKSLYLDTVIDLMKTSSARRGRWFPNYRGWKQSGPATRWSIIGGSAGLVLAVVGLLLGYAGTRSTEARQLFLDSELSATLSRMEAQDQETRAAASPQARPCHDLSKAELLVLGGLLKGSSAAARGFSLRRLFEMPLCQSLSQDPYGGTVEPFQLWGRLDFSGAVVDAAGENWVSVTGRNASGIRLDSARMTWVQFRSDDLRGANFKKAHLDTVHFLDSRLSRSKFDAARLAKVRFALSDLRLASFAATQFVEAEDHLFAGSILCGVDFSSSTGLRARHFVTACVDRTTKLPRAVDPRDVKIDETCSKCPILDTVLREIESGLRSNSGLTYP